MAKSRITLGQANAIRDVVDGLPTTLDASQKDHADQLLLAAGELRRLLRDAQFIPAVLGGQSEFLDLGRGRRLASSAQRHAIVPWQDGGPTSVDNLVALCVRHHQLCEPAPPETDQNGYASPPDQWRVKVRPGTSAEFVPPWP